MEETILISECRNKNHFAQRKLYERYVQKIFLVVVRYITDAHTAEEVTADTFIRCFEKLHLFEYRGEGSFYGWLKQIAVYACLDHLRARRMIFEPEGKMEETTIPATTGDALAKMQHDDIIKAIRQLPDGYRTVFNLYAIDGMTHAEIAQILNISEETSRSQLYKARMALQKTIRR